MGQVIQTTIFGGDEEAKAKPSSTPSSKPKVSKPRVAQSKYLVLIRKAIENGEPLDELAVDSTALKTYIDVLKAQKEVAGIKKYTADAASAELSLTEALESYGERVEARKKQSTHVPTIPVMFEGCDEVYPRDDETGFVYAYPTWWSRYINRSEGLSRITLLSSGRGAGKSRVLGLWVLVEGFKRKMRIICARETLRYTTDSTKKVIKEWIDTISVPFPPGFWQERGGSIYGANGTEILFRGLSSASGTAQRIKSIEGIDLVVVDEAQEVTQESLDVLLPTVRKENSKIVFSYNPSVPGEPMEGLEKRADEKYISHISVSWRDNPLFPAESEMDRVKCKQDTPMIYRHIWEGERLQDAADSLIPHELFEQCIVDLAWLRETHPGAFGAVYDIGVDLAIGAGEKADYSARVARVGAVVDSIERWRGLSLKETANRVQVLNESIYEVLDKTYFDATGVGAGFADNYDGDIEPVNFGGSVAGARNYYLGEQTNRDYFLRRNAQLYWVLRLRAQNTARLLKGEDVDPEECLFVSKTSADAEILRELADECARATCHLTSGGKLEVNKRGEKGLAKSPDCLDAMALAFANDSEAGVPQWLNRTEFQIAKVG